MLSHSVIPTESRTTLSEAEGDVRLSGGIPTLCPVPCRIREFYRDTRLCCAFPSFGNNRFWQSSLICAHLRNLRRTSTHAALGSSTKENFTCLAKCIALPDSLPPRCAIPNPALLVLIQSNFHALHSGRICSCGPTDAGEGAALLQTRVSRPRFFTLHDDESSDRRNPANCIPDRSL
jgi:hypothetical protein